MQAVDFFRQNADSLGAAHFSVAVANWSIRISGESSLLDEIRYSIGHLVTEQPPSIELTVIPRANVRGRLPKFESRRAVVSDELTYEYLGELDSIGFRSSSNRALLILGDNSPSLARPEGIRILIDWLLSNRGLFTLHGATVTWGKKTALISNRGGSGKSSTTAACVLAGAKTCGDDFLLGDETFALYSVSRTLKLAASSPAKSLYARATPGVRARFESDPGEDKELYLLDELVPNSMAPRALPDVLWVPRVSDGWRLTPISPLEVLQAVAPNSVAMNRERVAALNYVKQLIGSLPCFALEIGPDLAVGAEFLRTELSR